MVYQQRFKTPEYCPFCHDKVEPNYKDVKRLRGLMTEKGKIFARNRSGICQKHQRDFSTAVKQARLLALLPYVSVLK